MTRLLEEVKDKEAQGYAYEGADASFELLARRVLGEVPDYLRGRALPRRRRAPPQCARAISSRSRRPSSRCRIDGESSISAAEGNGPVNALDLALRKDLGKYQRFIEDLELVDYRVRVFQGGTDAVTRVLIEFGDESGETWSTVGVSANIIDASFQALIDAITYKLLKAGA